MAVFLLCLFTCLTIIGIFILRKINIINPLLCYFVFNWISGYGCFDFLDLDNPADLVHAIIILLSPILFIIGYLLAIGSSNVDLIYKSFWLKEERTLTLKQNIQMGILFIITIGLSVAYYQLVGYNLIFLSLTSEVDDFVTMRLEAYSGQNYYAPGVFNQFKNTLFPILFSYFYYINRDKKWVPYYVLVIGSILLYCILGTGQRTFLVTASIVIFFIFYALRKGKLNVKILTISGFVIFGIFTILSFYLKRSDSVGVLAGVDEVIHRIMDSNQYASVIGFRYIYKLDVVYGEEWLKSFQGLIPGVKGSNMSNRIFALIFGGYRGTAPLSVWGTTYHNFGFIGCLIMGAIIGFIYTKIYLRFIKGSFQILRICSYAGVFAYLSMWIAGAPSQLLNNGLIGCFLLLFISKIYSLTDETNNTRP